MPRSYSQTKFLKEKEKRDLINKIESQWHANCDFLRDKLINLSKENRIYVISPKILELRANIRLYGSIGLYFGKIELDGIRLSTEGAQLLKESPYKTIIDKAQAKRFFYGERIAVKHYNANPYTIVVYDDLVIGCGKIKQGILIPYIKKYYIGTTIL